MYPRSMRIRAQRLRADGYSQAAIAKRLGINPSTISSWEQGWISDTGGLVPAGGPRDPDGLTARQRLDVRSIPPKTWDQLSPEAQRALQDFGYFGWRYLRRRDKPWRRIAADTSVDLIQDKSERHYVDGNIAPGIGKTTLWTCDLPLWLSCGGGLCDPARGRAMRFGLGHEAQSVAQHYLQRIQRLMTLSRPYMDPQTHELAEGVLAQDFGRFRPEEGYGDEKIWSSKQFLVAQLADIDLYEKEPTFQIASYRMGFLGERWDYGVWDDLATMKNSQDLDAAERLNAFCENEAEPRIEPGGVFWLIGQRLGPLDLHRQRLNATWEDDDGNSHPKYTHIVFKAHRDRECDGNHRQWDGVEGPGAEHGCLLDEERLPWRDILKVRKQSNYATVYQQEESDPSAVLILPVWLTGGVDAWGDSVPGCYDADRDFMEWPGGDIHLINYATVDVAAGGWWAIEWWAVNPRTRISYLIYGRRARLPAGGTQGFLDWDAAHDRFEGVMEDMQGASAMARNPIRVWIIEANAAQKHLFQYNHFQRWLAQWGGLVTVIPHETQRNKNDPVLGVEATLRMRYRNGEKRLPHRNTAREGAHLWINYLRQKVHELENYPHVATTDTVMADWFGENHLDDVIRLGLRPMGTNVVNLPTGNIPPYLRRQGREIRRGLGWAPGV